jgi:hypothetical protein
MERFPEGSSVRRECFGCKGDKDGVEFQMVPLENGVKQPTPLCPECWAPYVQDEVSLRARAAARVAEGIAYYGELGSKLDQQSGMTKGRHYSKGVSSVSLEDMEAAMLNPNDSDPPDRPGDRAPSRPRPAPKKRRAKKATEKKLPRRKLSK